MDRLGQMLQAEALQTRARQTGFMQRKSKKISPLLFVQSAILLVGRSVVSLRQWAALLGLLGNHSVAKQSLWERITQNAVVFLEQTLAMVLAERVTSGRGSVPQALRSFPRVLIQDSTTIQLTPALAEAFPGSCNQCGTTHGQLKIQSIYDLRAQQFVSFGLSGFNRNDQAAAQDVLALAQPGDLILRDLGYFVVATLQRIALLGAFFISRLRLDTAVFDLDTQRRINLLQQLRRRGNIDREVLVGQQKLRARLVAIKLPEPIAAERRRKARQNRDKRCRPNAAHLALLGWAIFLTNVDRKVLSAHAVASVYGLRWRIEVIFKSWKSHFRITEVPEGSPEQLRCVFYARLIFLAVVAQFCTSSWQDSWRAHDPPPRSLLKAAALLGDLFLSLCLELWGIKIADALSRQLDYHCRYERRTRKNFIQNATELS